MIEILKSILLGIKGQIIVIEGLDGMTLTNNVTSLNKWFEGYSKLETVSGMRNWNAPGVTNVSQMFNNCTSLETVTGLSNWTVSNKDTVNGKTNMFSGCPVNGLDVTTTWSSAS